MTMIPFRQIKIYLHHILPPVPISVVISSIVRVILLFHNWLLRGFLATLEKEKRNTHTQKHEKHADDADGYGGRC